MTKTSLKKLIRNKGKLVLKKDFDFSTELKKSFEIALS